MFDDPQIAHIMNIQLVNGTNLQIKYQIFKLKNSQINLLKIYVIFKKKFKNLQNLKWLYCAFFNLHNMFHIAPLCILLQITISIYIQLISWKLAD